MKKYITIAATLIIAIALISWGRTGHSTIGKIAENHLSAKAKAGVQELLGTETLADVASWADEVRNKPEYKETGPWHFLNLPLGLTYLQFEQKVRDMSEANVYSALANCERDLLYQETPREKKIEALKFIVHFVGDLHQPMHISRAEDKGGNSIQLNYEGKGTNLHSLWDTKMLEHQGLTYQQLAEKYDHATPQQIKQWQSDPLMKWIWESYEISSKLYAEVDAMNGRSIDDAYYQAHIGIVETRIEQAGIRLAGVLNEIFKGGAINGGMIPPPAIMALKPAADAETKTICEKVFSFKVMDGSQMTLLNLGGNYPDQKLTVMISGKDREKFKVAPEIAFKDKQICVTGKVIDYRGKPEIIVTDPAQIQIKD